MPKISIALATCNGARYLPELLDSLAGQSLPPFELVACDDASSDATCCLLNDYSRRAPFHVHIHERSRPLGVVGNFEDAIGKCRGDVIALADQDDVWRADKLERLLMALCTPEVQAAFSDARLVDADMKPLGYSMWERVSFSRREQDRFATNGGFSVLLKHRVVTGATLVFRSNLRDIALPIPPHWPHDAWLAAIVAATNARSLIAVGEPLVAYRQHDANVVGGVRKSFFEEAHAALGVDRCAWYRDEVALWQALAERLTGRGLSIPRELDEKIAHLKRRANLPISRWRRVPDVIHELVTGGYGRYARNWGSAAIDLLVR